MGKGPAISQRPMGLMDRRFIAKRPIMTVGLMVQCPKSPIPQKFFPQTKILWQNKYINSPIFYEESNTFDQDDFFTREAMPPERVLLLRFPSPETVLKIYKQKCSKTKIYT